MHSMKEKEMYGGIVENESGESQELDVDTQNHELTTTYSYLLCGNIYYDYLSL